MERILLRQNVAHFKKPLESELDEADRRIVQKMLADAEAELARLDPEGLVATDTISARLAALTAVEPQRRLESSRASDQETPDEAGAQDAGASGGA